MDTGITIEVASFVENVEELHPIFLSHYDELEDEEGKEKMPFNFNYEGYAFMEGSGQLLCILVKKNNQLIGYCMNLLMVSYFSKTIQTCFTHIFYILPDHRTAMTGLKTLRFLDNWLKENGVKEWIAAHRIDIDLQKLYKRLGLKKLEIVYRKVMEV